MNDFWDAFIFRVSFGLTEDCFHPGRSAAEHLFQTAEQLNLFSVADRSDLSILLLLLSTRAGSPVHEAALAEHQNRSLTPLREWGALREALSPRLTELHLFDFFGQPRQQALVRGVLRTFLLPGLIQFTARMTLGDYDLVRALVTPLFWNTLRTLGPDAITAEGLLPHLYRTVFASLGRTPTQWPPKPPAWQPSLVADEQRFLDCCLALVKEDRLTQGNQCLLYLSLYGQLNPQQIADLLREDIATVRADHVVGWLETSWAMVLRCMTGQDPG